MPSVPEKSTYSRKKEIKRVATIWWAVTILAAVLMIWGSTFNLRGLSVYMGLWLVISLLCYYFSTKWTFNNSLGLRPNILEIPVYISFTMLVLIALFGVAPYFNDRYLLRQLSSVDELPMGLFLSGVGLLSMWIGYWIVVRRWSIKNNNAESVKLNKNFLHNLSSPSMTRVMLAYFVLIGLRLILFYAGGGEIYGKTLSFGDWNQWVTYPLQLRWFFIALVILQALNGRWPRFFALVVIGFEVAMAVVTGWSSTLIKIAITLAGCLLYSKNKLPVRTLVIGGMVFLIAFTFLTPISRFYRSVNNSSLLNTLTALSEGVGMFKNSNESLLFTADLLVKRQTATAQTPSLFLKFTPAYVPYRPIEDMFLVPISFIPRVVWPNKPEYTLLGKIVTRDYFGVFRIDPSSSASTFAGSAYIYGGWGVVIVSMFMLGIVSAFLYALLALPSLRGGNIGLLALYIAVVITNFHIGEGDILGLWQGIFQSTLVFYAFLLLLSVGVREKVNLHIDEQKT